MLHQENNNLPWNVPFVPKELFQRNVSLSSEGMSALMSACFFVKKGIIKPTNGKIKHKKAIKLLKNYQSLPNFAKGYLIVHEYCTQYITRIGPGHGHLHL